MRITNANAFLSFENWPRRLQQVVLIAAVVFLMLDFLVMAFVPRPAEIRWERIDPAPTHAQPAAHQQSP